MGLRQAAGQQARPAPDWLKTAGIYQIWVRSYTPEGTIRLKLLKVAARVTVSVRRVYIQLSSAYPRPDLFRLCHARLLRLASADG